MKAQIFLEFSFLESTPLTDENAEGVYHLQPRVARRRRATLGNQHKTIATLKGLPTLGERG